MSMREKEKENLKDCFNKLITMDIKDIMLLDKNDDIKNIKFRKPVAHKGEKHHFYGKSFNKEHKKNLGKSISVARRQYNDDQFMELLRMKLSCLKLEEITENFREKTGINICRDTISHIWNGKIHPVDKELISTDEYKNLISFKRKKISPLRILNDSQIDEIFLLKDSNKSSIIVSKEINKKYNIKVSPATISDVWNKKLLPLYQLRNLNK